LLAAKDLGQTAMAITDHGTLVGHRPMQEAAEKVGIKPILGVEAYISETDRFDRRTKAFRGDGTNIYNHIILLAKDHVGVRNLNKLSEIAWTEGFYHKPRIDMESLEKHRDGLIVLSGCMSGLIAKALERGDKSRAEDIALDLKDMFDDDFYIEVQAHNPAELNAGLLDIADRFNIRPVITSDCHFAREESRVAEEALLILATKPGFNTDAEFSKSRAMSDMLERFNYLYPSRPISFADIDLFVQSRLQLSNAMLSNGVDRTDIYESSLEIADKVSSYEYHKALDLLPVPKSDPYDRLVTLCNQGLKRLKIDNDIYRARLLEELEVISEKNFSSYFLIISDAIRWARSQGIAVGPARGSSAGSLVCYALGITQVDPIKYDLLFSRFLNPERNDYPDIDVDFQHDRRGEVKEYLHRKFKHVASIGTLNMFRDKNVIKDAARVFRIPLSEVNIALKNVKTFEDFETSMDTQSFRDKYPEVLRLARQLRGKVREVGMHAAGVVVANRPLSDIVPVETRIDKENKVSGRIPVIPYDMNTVEEIGLIKFDLLGLKNLTMVQHTLESIKQRHGKDIDLLSLTLDDKHVFDDLANGFTQGIFQAEQPAYTNLLKEMGVESFEDIVASNALVRPGAMNTVGPEYVNRKKGKSSITYMHDLLKPFTENTYGVIIYQEQVMQALVYLGGFSWSEADRIRKIIGKKQSVRGFDKYKEHFIEGASKHITSQAAEHLWHDFEAHAGYSFNRSHAVAYSMITYWTAWLKHYYPLEFMTSLLVNEESKTKISEYLIEINRLGIQMMMPHINKSDKNFSIRDEQILFGLGNIKDMPELAIEEILHTRPYKNYQQLFEQYQTKGNPINKKAIDALNAIGAAEFGDNRLTGKEQDNYYEYLAIPKFSDVGLSDDLLKQITMLEDYDEGGTFIIKALAKAIKIGDGWSRIDFIDSTGSAGVFHNQNTQITTGQQYLMLVSKNSVMRYIPVNEIDDKIEHGDVLMRWLMADSLKIDPALKVVIATNARITKNNKKLIDVVLSDADKQLTRALVFSSLFAKGLSYLKPGSVVNVSLSSLDDGTIFIKEIRSV
jgi:DNA polymerase-3 subunit alpha